MRLCKNSILIVQFSHNSDANGLGGRLSCVMNGRGHYCLDRLNSTFLDCILWCFIGCQLPIAYSMCQCSDGSFISSLSIALKLETRNPVGIEMFFVKVRNINPALRLSGPLSCCFRVLSCHCFGFGTTRLLDLSASSEQSLSNLSFAF